MPFYHATRRSRLPSIMSIGLRGSEEQNFECEAGVYLARSPIIAWYFLLEDLIERMDDSTSPSGEMADFIVIVVDDSRVEAARLRPDPNVEGRWQDELHLYDGIIDVRGMPILDADMLFPA